MNVLSSQAPAGVRKATLLFFFEHVPLSLLVVDDKRRLTREIRPHLTTPPERACMNRSALPQRLWGPGPGWLIPPTLVGVAVKSQLC